MLRFIVPAVCALGVVFVLLLGTALPEVVASHFGPSGRPDGFMPRSVFVALMAALVGGVPLLVWWLQLRSIRSGQLRIPHGDFWRSPAQLASTDIWLSRHAAAMAIVTTVFLCSVYAMVVAANREPVVALGAVPLWLALIGYVAFTGLWVLRLHRRFRRP
ncbi:MAG: DUF1648 domain-containing protein [Rubrivivax sp.]